MLLSAQAGDFVARHFVGRGWRVFRRRTGSAFRVVAPGAAFLPRGLQRPFGEGACGLLSFELFLEFGEPFFERLPLGVGLSGILCPGP